MAPKVPGCGYGTNRLVTQCGASRTPCHCGPPHIKVNQGLSTPKAALDDMIYSDRHSLAEMLGTEVKVRWLR
ncbi:MAG: hypothetical protein NVSMB26_18930 [Beijerinckiaceae bacterium]